MAEGKDIHAAQQENQPGTRPSLRSRVWGLTGLGDKTAWDLLQLLIVPLALAAIGFWFTAQQEARQQELEDQRAQLEREIEAQRAEQATFQTYLDQMGTLLLDRGLRAADENSDVRRLARARTLVVLDALSPPRQERALRFLKEAELIQGSPPDEQPVITLKYASLPDSALPHRILLRGANLQQADLSGSNLAHIDLRGTYLAGAHLEDADLEGADLSGAYLGGANLKGASVNDEQLATCKSLEGATMPDGSKHD